MLVGCFLEGETILLLGGVAAEQGYLSLPGGIVAAFVGSMSGDQLFFYVGRCYGPGLIERKPRLKKASVVLQERLAKRQTLLILGFRFLYGLRSAAPFVFGASAVGRGRFALFNACAAAIGANALAYGGYLAGRAFTGFALHFARYELEALAAAAVGAGIRLGSRDRS